MLTIQTQATLNPPNRLTIQLPADLPAGEYNIVLVIDDRSQSRSESAALPTFPVTDYGPWPETLSLHRQDLYSDDGR
ncbi:hypothetical protein HC928_20170 [bacterium]|nr:hypothetical protein [bacterium]